MARSPESFASTPSETGKKSPDLHLSPPEKPVGALGALRDTPDAMNDSRYSVEHPEKREHISRINNPLAQKWLKEIYSYKDYQLMLRFVRRKKFARAKMESNLYTFATVVNVNGRATGWEPTLCFLEALRMVKPRIFFDRGLLRSRISLPHSTVSSDARGAPSEK